MTGDLSRTHSRRVHRYDLVIEARETALAFSNQLRGETARPIACYFHLDPPPVSRHCLAAIAVWGVAPLFVLAKMVIHLRIERPFGKRLLLGIEPAALA
jgi:hypothetical protein